MQGTSREAFISAHVTSAYSLVSTVRHALPFLSPGASVVALTYIGSQRVSAGFGDPTSYAVSGHQRLVCVALIADTQRRILLRGRFFRYLHQRCETRG